MACDFSVIVLRLSTAVMSDSIFESVTTASEASHYAKIDLKRALRQATESLEIIGSFRSRGFGQLHHSSWYSELGFNV